MKYKDYIAEWLCYVKHNKKSDCDCVACRMQRELEAANPVFYTAADLAKAREEGRRELEAKVSAMVAVLKDYERWEANLVMCDEAWRDRSYPAVFTEELYASFFSIQGKRNAALLAEGKKEREDGV